MTRVHAGSSAAAAGLRPGDVITAVNGQTIKNQQELANQEGLLPVGKTAELTLQRDGKALIKRASVAARKTELAGGALDKRLAGGRFGVVSERLRRQGVNGVLVLGVDAGSQAASNGLREGDLITAVNRNDVSDLIAFERSLGTPPPQLLLTLVRGNRAYFAVME